GWSAPGLARPPRGAPRRAGSARGAAAQRAPRDRVPTQACRARVRDRAVDAVRRRAGRRTGSVASRPVGIAGQHGIIDDARREFLAAACRGLAERDWLIGVSVRFGAELGAVALTILDCDST